MNNCQKCGRDFAGTDCRICAADQMLYEMQATIEPFLDYATSKGYPEMRQLAKHFILQSVKGDSQYFCADCHDTGILYVDGGARWIGNPTGEYETDCHCRSVRDQLFDDSVDTIGETVIPF